VVAVQKALEAGREIFGFEGWPTVIGEEWMCHRKYLAFLICSFSTGYVQYSIPASEKSISTETFIKEKGKEVGACPTSFGAILNYE
jgi:hypothetical protein